MFYDKHCAMRSQVIFREKKCLKVGSCIHIEYMENGICTCTNIKRITYLHDGEMSHHDKSFPVSSFLVAKSFRRLWMLAHILCRCCVLTKALSFIKMKAFSFTFHFISLSY